MSENEGTYGETGFGYGDGTYGQMSDDTPITDMAERMLEFLPPFVQATREIKRIISACANELDRVEAAKAALLANAFPQTGDMYLKFWEALLSLPIEPPDRTLPQRRTTVIAYLQSIKASGSGLSWQENLSALIGGGWSYEEHNPDDPLSPDPHTILIKLPFEEGAITTRAAEKLARDITPAHIDLIFGYGEGFIVGISEVGEEPL